LEIAYACDWDIPSDSGVDNRGFVDPAEQLLYFQGQYPGSPDNYDDFYGGFAYRADDSATMLADAGWVWENDTYVYPDGGYHVDSLAAYLAVNSGWLPTDSTEDVSGIILVQRDTIIDIGDTISFSIIFAASRTGYADLTESIDQAERFICEYVAPDAAHCIQCDFLPGDCDGNGVLNISDAVRKILYIFGGGIEMCYPYPICNCDATCDCMCNVSDVVYEIGYIFGGGPMPCSCEEWVARCGWPLR
jgi:hypothetical protein